MTSLFENYKRAPVAFVRGEGARLFDRDGKDYIDLLAGIATSSLGHGHGGLVEALSAQAAKVLHVSNLFEIPEQEAAALSLVAAATRADSPWAEGEANAPRVFFCNSGAEANEAAIKLARKWGADSGRFEVVSNQNGFHGRTMGALAATGTAAYHQGFQPLPGGFRSVPFNDLDALDAAVGDHTCGVLIEPIQGEAGVILSDDDYLKGAAELCRKRGALLILDEVQTGIGRTGSMFAFQHYGVSPDIVNLAKGLGGGVPVGAVLARKEVALHFQPGSHGTTFGGNPLAMVAVAAVQKALVDEGVLNNAVSAGKKLRAALEDLGRRTSKLRSVRGVGLMLAVELASGDSAADLAARCLEHGVVVHAVRPETIRLLPPLVISESEIDEGVRRLEAAVLAG